MAADPAPRPSRRSFTAAYKLAIVAQYEAVPHGVKSAVLRREGLYHSHIKEWAPRPRRRAYSGLADARKSAPGSKVATKGEVDRLRAKGLHQIRYLVVANHERRDPHKLLTAMSRRVTKPSSAA